MLLCRFKTDNDTRLGLVQHDKIEALKGSLFDQDHIPTGETLSLNNVRLAAPCAPTKIVAVGLNYRDHAKELHMGMPERPLIFIKPSTSVIGPLDEIIYPACVKRLDYEAELAIVIRKFCKDIEAGSAADYILGYTALNDVTARDLQKADGQWTRAKSFDTFCPIGPFIATDISADNLDLKLTLNGTVKQSSNTRNLLFKPNELVSFISKICTLLPGDVIATGTPGGVGPMEPGDVVEVSIEKIGTLKNMVAGKKHV
ncbi:MAG: fumarylacetoacetate hydrolase family protein [Candidatus Omnitrophota bacterium]